MKTYRYASLLCLTLSPFSAASSRRLGDNIDRDVDNRDNIILEDCEGHKKDDVNYITPPENCCMTPGGLMGVWGCRQEPQEHSICLPSFGGDVIGKQGDQCGPCAGVIPSLCKCPCKGGVKVLQPFIFGFKITRCYPEGLAEAMVMDGDDVQCDTSC